MVRDIIVFRIKSACEDKKDRKEFLKRADEAYGWILTTKEEDYEELQSQLFLAYHKDPKNADGFQSKNAKATEIRGAPRPRRGRDSAKELPSAASKSCQTDSAGASPSRSPALTPFVKPKHKGSCRSPVRGAMPRAPSGPCPCILPAKNKMLGFLPSSFGPFGAQCRPSESLLMAYNPDPHLSSSSSRLPTHVASSCLPCHPPLHQRWGSHPALHDRTMYGNNYGMGFPSPLLEMPVPLDSPMPTALQSSKPWQVLILMELNHLLVHCDLQAMLDESWGVSMDFDDGYQMYIRPGAIDVLCSVLDEAQKSCTLGIFTGMSSDLALQMVKELLKQTIVEKKQDEWQVMHHGNESVSLFNKDLKLRVFIFQRTEHEESDPEEETLMEEDKTRIINSAGFKLISSRQSSSRTPRASVSVSRTLCLSPSRRSATFSLTTSSAWRSGYGMKMATT